MKISTYVVVDEKGDQLSLPLVTKEAVTLHVEQLQDLLSRAPDFSVAHEFTKALTTKTITIAPEDYRMLLKAAGYETGVSQ